MPNNNPTGKGGFGERPHNINRKGRPKSFDQLRDLAQQIAHETLDLSDGSRRTVAEAIVRKIATEDPKLFLEIAFGKVPNPVEISGPDGGELVIAVVQKDHYEAI
ncbi:MAG: hypothetical protein O3A51_07730 [Verrucomicrobia bacterium]|nr:hypothetical protein [Verrucomicrobiota bacterium]